MQPLAIGVLVSGGLVVLGVLVTLIVTRRDTKPGRGGEIQLTDALRTLARTDRSEGNDGGGVHGVLFRGRRYDTGNKLDYLQTQIKFACERPDVAPQFVPWLRSYLADLDETTTQL